MRDNLLAFFWAPLKPRANIKPMPEELWRSAFLFSLYRLVLGGLLLFLTSVFGDMLSLGADNAPLFIRTSIVYITLALFSQLLIKLRQPRFYLQLAFQVGTDIACLTVLSYASGGIQSGINLLLLVSLAAAGMISRGKITLFFASLASIAVLLQHSYAVLLQGASPALYWQAGLLSVAYFVFAWMAHTLAKYTSASESLAASRGVDLSNMAEANRLVIQDMPDGVLVVDEQGVIRQCNPSAERLLGFSFAPGQDLALGACSPLLAERFMGWRQNLDRRTEEMRLPGTEYPVRLRFLPVQREGFWGAVVFLENLQRARAEAQQIKLAALGRLTANVAHEVRNPLSAISHATELLREGEPVPGQRRLLEIIMDNTVRLDNIVQDILQLNRRDRASREPVPLAEKLRLFVESLCQRENVPQEIFRIEAAEAETVCFDRGHLEQVLWNLCRNALRYCSRQAGSVRLLAARINQNGVALDVFNDGPPVEPGAIPQLFEPFFTTSAGGTGLGLYIARELCEANGATLAYVPLESGACFRIVFGGRNER